MYAYICIGKTYFITTLISILLQGQCKVVVSASSNKAVCVALEELLSIPWVHKHKRVVLVGVEDTIDSVSSVAPSTTLSTPSTTSNHHTAHPLADYSIHIPLKHQLPSHLTDQINQFLHPTSAKDVYAFAYLSRLERIMDVVSVYLSETTQAFNKIYLPQASPTTSTTSTTPAANTIDMFPPLPPLPTHTKQDSKHSNNGHGARKHLKSKPTFSLYNYFQNLQLSTVPTDNSYTSTSNNTHINTTTDNTNNTSTDNTTTTTTTNTTNTTSNNINTTTIPAHDKDTLTSLTHEYTRLQWLFDHIIRISTHISYIAITIYTSATDLFLAHFKTNFRLFFRASDRLIGLIEALIVELYCYIHNIILPNEHNISNNIISNTTNMHSDSSDSNTVRQHNICNYIHDISTQFKHINNTLCTITSTILAFTATTSSTSSSSDLFG